MTRRLPSPDDVLAGTASVDVSGLVSLVHAVNPTDRGLRASVAEARYAQKARLQSLLLRRFPDRVVIRRDPRDEDLVVLDVPLDGRDAGHARVSQLDDDVRPVVWAALAEDTPQATTPSARHRREAAPRAGPEALVEEGDYAGAAEAWLAEARRGSASAACEALTLWLDWLGDLERAREAWATLPAPIRSDPGARATMARGEVRAGALGQARVLLEGATGEAAGGAWAELGEALFAAGDLVGARSAARASAEADAGQRQAALAIEDRVRAAQDAQRAPLRQAVDQACEAEVEAALDALEAAFPGDPHAVRVRTRLAAARAADQAARDLAEADRAVDAGRLDLAQHLLQRLGADAPPEVRAAAGAVRQRLAAARSAAEVTRVAERLRHDPAGEALVAWLELDDADRTQALGDLALPVAELAREMDQHHRRKARAVVAAAEAVLAAQRALGAGDPERAESLLGPHVDLLVGAGRRLLADVHREIAALRAEQARTLLVQAEARLEADDVREATSLAARVVRDRLDAPHQERLDHLLVVFSAVAAESDALATFETALRLEPWRARDLAEGMPKMPAGTGAFEEAVWSARAQQATRTTQAAWAAQPLGAASSLPRIPHIGQWAHDGRARCVITEDQRSIVLAEPLGAWVAVHVAAIPAPGAPPRLGAVRTLLFRPPTPAESVQVTLTGRRAWVHGKAGWVVQVDVDALEIVRWVQVAANARVEVLADEICAAVDRGWARLDPILLRPTARRPRLEVQAQRVAGAPYGVGLQRNEYFVLDADGATSVGKLDLPHRRATVGARPGGVVVAAGFDPGPDRRPGRYELWAVEGGAARRVCALEQAQEPIWLGVDGDLAVVGWIVRPGLELHGVDLTSGRRLWSTTAAGDTILVQGCTGGPVCALSLGPQGGELHRLGRGRPALPGVSPVPLGLSLEVETERRCDLTSEATAAEARLVAAQRACDRRDWTAALALLPESPGGDPTSDHAVHLRAVAAAMAGDLPALDAALGRLRAVTCDLRSLPAIAAARAKLDRWLPIGADPRLLTALRSHVDVVGKADAALAAGDPAAAWQALDDVPSWHTDDAQLAARRVEAVLALEDPPLLDLLRAASSLQEATGDVPGVPSWPTSRLEDLLERAEAEAARRTAVR